MNDREAFIRAVIARPDDDLPRLIFADWLDEQGDPLGEFIRVQCGLAALIGDGKRCPVCDWSFRDDGSGCQPGNCSFRPSEHTSEHARWLPRQKHFHALRRREREIADAHEDEWSKGLPQRLLRVGVGGRYAITYTYRRGFVEEITCSWPDCRAHLDSIRQRTPIRLVRLSDWPTANIPERLVATDGVVDWKATLEKKWPGITFELPAMVTA